MKNYLVIGNPIEHSLSPLLHNFWIKKYHISAIYKKKELERNNIAKIISDLREDKINGINVTVPFKKDVIPFLDGMSDIAKETNSVNTIYKKEAKVIGDNTDVYGFSTAIKLSNFDPKNKKALILGAGGVSPSIIFALKKMGISEIILSNRTKQKAESLKKLFPYVKIINWGETAKFDLIVNTTSVGIKNNEEIKLDLSELGGDLFYDLIYNPSQTNFLKKAKKLGKKTENGKNMFIYQAARAFKIWHNIDPEVNSEVEDLIK